MRSQPKIVISNVTCSVQIPNIWSYIALPCIYDLTQRPTRFQASKDRSLLQAIAQPHILLVTFPSQGTINPSLQFSKRLIGLGAHVTFATSFSAFKKMAKTLDLDGLTFATYSDGYDDGFSLDGDVDLYMEELKRHGSESLADLIESRKKNGCPFTRLVYTFPPWIAEVARQAQLPATLLWIQPALVFDIYYGYCNGYKEVMEKNMNDLSLSFELPGLPRLTGRDLPSILDPSCPHSFGISAIQLQQQILSEETNPTILVNTYDGLEPEALRAVDNFNLIGVGPLIPSAFLGAKDPFDTSFGGDLFQNHSKDYLEWLNSKDPSSVIYVSFGSLSVLSKRQMEEIANGLLDSGRPFLWVIRGIENEEDTKEEKLSRIAELEKQGMMVPWCSQVEVLSHSSIGCFVTHCGWNSSSESIALGVPMVAFPQWSDQLTIAKLIQDVWKIGVRVAKNEEGIVEGGEIKRCLDSVMGDGEKSQTMRKNAKKLQLLATAATEEDGSSEKNLRKFVAEIGKGCHLIGVHK